MNFTGFTCAHSVKEWEEQENRIALLQEDSSLNRRFYKGFGIHPWKPVIENADFLEKLLQKNKLDGIGEAGFDFFTDELKATKEIQKECWNIQIELALKYNKPVVVHLRKGFEEIYKDRERLKKLSGVLFHGFSGNYLEAENLLKKIPCAQFSFGAVLLNGGKKAIECIKALPEQSVLFETDEAGIMKLPLVYAAAKDYGAPPKAKTGLNGVKEDFDR